MTDKIPSPCVRNCCLNEVDICLGCYRHIDEILIWGNASNTEKLAVLALVEQRKEQELLVKKSSFFTNKNK